MSHSYMTLLSFWCLIHRMSSVVSTVCTVEAIGRDQYNMYMLNTWSNQEDLLRSPTPKTKSKLAGCLYDEGWCTDCHAHMQRGRDEYFLQAQKSAIIISSFSIWHGEITTGKEVWFAEYSGPEDTNRSSCFSWCQNTWWCLCGAFPVNNWHHG